MFPTSVLRAAQQQASTAPRPFDFAGNRFKAKRSWPPDFDKLSGKYQLRLERRYKRRSKLKWARPRLMVATKLAQWVSGIGVLIYGVFYMDWKNDDAFRGIRQWANRTTGGFVPCPPAALPQSAPRVLDQHDDR